MNKILLLSDKDQVPQGAFDFACLLNEQQPILLTGLFLPDTDLWDLLLLPANGAAAPMTGPYTYYLAAGQPGVGAEAVMDRFGAQCRRNGIEYRTHELEDIRVVSQLLKETRFADLMVFSSLPFFEDVIGTELNSESEDTLHSAECPVVIVPEHFQPPKQLILAYDGTASSVFAIRQFAQLMPELAELPALLVYAHPEDGGDIPDLPYIEELATRHFPQLTIMQLDIDPKAYFNTWLTDRQEAMLVTGAKGRSGLSELLHRSFIGEVLKERKLPLFLAHR